MAEQGVANDQVLSHLMAFICGVLVATVAWLAVALFFGFFRPWLRGFLSGAPISLIGLLGMRLRGTPVNLVLDALIALRHSGDANVSFKEVEIAYLKYKPRIMTGEDLVEVVRKERLVAV